MKKQTQVVVEAYHGGHLLGRNAAQFVGFVGNLLHREHRLVVFTSCLVLESLREGKPAKRNASSCGRVLLCISKHDVTKLERGFVG